MEKCLPNKPGCLKILAVFILTISVAPKYAANTKMTFRIPCIIHIASCGFFSHICDHTIKTGSLLMKNVRPPGARHYNFSWTWHSGGKYINDANIILSGPISEEEHRI